MNEQELFKLKVGRLSYGSFPLLKRVAQNSDLGKAINDSLIAYKDHWFSYFHHVDLLRQYIDDWKMIPRNQLQATIDGMKRGADIHDEASARAEKLMFQSDFKNDQEIREFVLGLGSAQFMR
ncbi:hypothetical protein [Delftia tsuruhatensis]|uniref:hypothetical protein n=1 Tax=Delftia tsuruhatensis TaxID=180282 RepID=UPI002090DE05|nr:hypothetical protein [Delftia tsuruhatensis]MCO5336015.1 hypothetical protein [Delftia tsuruhatensis]MCR4544084.1 hypothetical protein [Delftia tsuruhatensis]